VQIDRDGKVLLSFPTTALSSICTKPEPALGMLQAGQTVTIAGSNMAELRRLWAEWHATQR